MRLRKTIAAIALYGICLITIQQCKKEASKSELPINETITIRNGQALQNSEPVMSLKFDGVQNESRCPIDATCISAGNAAVQFVLTSGDSIQSFILNTDMAPVDSVAFGYRVELLELSPLPSANKTLDPKEYSAKVKVTRD
jgi:hypothetical protein